MPTPLAAPGPRLVDGDNIQDLANNDVNKCSSAITALAGGGRSANTPVLNAGFSDIRTVATSADSVVLPVARAGIARFVPNPSGTTLTVFANGSDTINGTAGATGVTQTTGVNALYFCARDGVWARIMSA